MSKTLKLVSPIDGSVYAERPVASQADIELQLFRIRQAQQAWAREPLETRVETVRSAIEALRSMNDQIVPELAWSMGRPVRYGGEIGGVEERAYHMADIAGEALAPIDIEDSEEFRRYITREPAGIVFVMAPWNYPYLTAINTIAPALIAGNAVVLKHATQTLLTGERFEQAFAQAGLPDAVFTNLFLDHETTEKLLAAGSFDHVNFTGSVEGGRTIERAAAGSFATVGLELGGKDPGYVMEDADLDAAVDTLIDGAMFNAGQCCCGIERIYVAEALYDRFVDKAVAIVEGYLLGNPLEEATTLGPMAHLRHAHEVRVQSGQAIASGARQLIDPTLFPADDGGTYVAPQILVDVDHEMRVMRDETFGPGRRHHEGEGRRRGDPADERQRVRPDRVALDQGSRPRRRHRQPNPDRNGLHEPLRLSRSRALLDRLQAHRQGRGAVGDRLSQSDPPEILPSEEGLNAR